MVALPYVVRTFTLIMTAPIQPFNRRHPVIPPLRTSGHPRPILRPPCDRPQPTSWPPTLQRPLTHFSPTLNTYAPRPRPSPNQQLADHPVLCLKCKQCWTAARSGDRCRNIRHLTELGLSGTYLYIHTYIPTYVNIHTYMCIRIHTYIYMYVYVYVYVYV